MNFNPRTTMKTILRYSMLVLAIAYPGAAIAGFAGLAPSTAFAGSEIGCWLFALAGLMLVGLGDTARRPLVLRRAPACPVVPFRPMRTVRADSARRATAAA
jgi:hypothetical protein